MKYIDYIAYPIMLGVIYVLLGFVMWDKDPGTWGWECRITWVLWGVAWGFALSLRILKEQGRPTWTL